MATHKEFTRKELYDLAWSTPMTKLAKQFGLSDVGLRKICAKHRIPTPPLGYWAKLQFGKPVKQTPFPPTQSGERDKVLVTVSAVREVPESVSVAELKARESLQTKIAVPSALPPTLHRTAAVTRRALKSATPDHEGFVRTVNKPGTIGTAIGLANIDRVAAIIDTIARALEGRGQQIVGTDEGAEIIVENERLKLSIYETKDKAPHQPTEAELQAKARWEADRIKWPSLYSSNTMHWRRWDHSPSGRLCIVLENPAAYSWKSEHKLGRWYDRKNGQVEEYLNDIIVAMHAGAALVRHHRLLAEEAERRREEAATRLRRLRERRELIAKRDAFIEQRAKNYSRLAELRAFSEYLASQADNTGDGIAEVAEAARDLVERLTRTLSVTELNKEFDRLGSASLDDQGII